MRTAEERMKFVGLRDGGWLGEEGLDCLGRTLPNGARLCWPADRF